MTSSPNSIERCAKKRYAFTLVELLVVVGIMAVLMSLALPAFNAIKGSRDLAATAEEIKGVLDQARSYALANNTYVFVGIQEVDASVSASAASQTEATDTKGGRVVMAVVASRDGLRGYDVNNTKQNTPPWPTNTGNTLKAVSKLWVFEKVHLKISGEWNGYGTPGTDTNSQTVGEGGMIRPYVPSRSYVLSGRTMYSGGAVTQFAWPLGRALGDGQYNFPTVINFDPLGVPRVQTRGNTDTLSRYFEIGLVPLTGYLVPQTDPDNIAAIQIHGITGATRVYRP